MAYGFFPAHRWVIFQITHSGAVGSCSSPVRSNQKSLYQKGKVVQLFSLYLREWASLKTSAYLHLTPKDVNKNTTKNRSLVIYPKDQRETDSTRAHVVFILVKLHFRGSVLLTSLPFRLGLSGMVKLKKFFQFLQVKRQTE